ncbi:MAG: hypothetical protein ACOYN2_02875 [Patescibacteria group bacterium]
MYVEFPSPDQNNGKFIDLQKWRISPALWEEIAKFKGQKIILATLFYSFDLQDLQNLASSKTRKIEMPPSFFFRDTAAEQFYVQSFKFGGPFVRDSGKGILEKR